MNSNKTIMKSLVHQLITYLLLIIFVGCQNNNTQSEREIPNNSISADSVQKKRQFPNALENGKIFSKNGRKMLFGGNDSTWHFDISNCSLNDSNFHYGIGRESFAALIKPEFISIEQAKTDTSIKDTSRFLVVNINDDIRAYSIHLLTQHEVINDVVGGRKIMAAYCILANLGAIYERNIGGKEFTFALSGYTYHDKNVWNNLDGFVFWDRETESIWWPLIGKAVSGKMKDIKLSELNREDWEDTTWGKIKLKYKNIKVLKADQKMMPPKKWRKYSGIDIERIRVNINEN